MDESGRPTESDNRDTSQSNARNASADAIPRAAMTLGLWTLAIVLMFYYANATRFVVLGGLAALALAALLQPLADRLPGPSALRAMVVMVVFLIAAGAVLGTLGYLLHEPISQSIQEWPETATDINATLRDVTHHFGIKEQITVAEIGNVSGRTLTGGSMSRWLSNVAAGVLNTLLAIVVVLIASMYLIARPSGSLAEKAIALLPGKRQKPTLDALNELRPELRWWVLGTVFSMIVVGGVFGVGYVLIGLKFAIPLAVFAAVAQAVPTFGPMVTLLLSVLVAVSQGTGQIVGVGVIYVVVQSVESYLLTPMVMQRAVRIPPVITLFTIILWGNVLGVAGLILAIPLDLTVWMMLKHHVLMDRESPVSHRERDRRCPPASS